MDRYIFTFIYILLILVYHFIKQFLFYLLLLARYFVFFQLKLGVYLLILIENRGYFTSDNQPGGIENATHNTFS
jgi:hypothetical protein